MAPTPTTAAGEAAVGPWRAVISREQSVYPGAHTDYFVQFYAGEGRVANFKSAHLWLNRTDESRAAPGELLGHTHSMHAHVPTPADVSGISAVTLDVQSWDNKQFSQVVPLSLAEAPQVVLEPGAAKRKHADPSPYIPAPGTLFAVAWGYFLVASAAAVLWLLTDRAIPPVQHHKAEPGTDHVTTQRS